MNKSICIKNAVQTHHIAGTYDNCFSSCKKITVIKEIFNPFTKQWDRSKRFCVACDRKAIRLGLRKPWPKWW